VRSAGGAGARQLDGVLGLMHARDRVSARLRPRPPAPLLFAAGVAAAARPRARRGGSPVGAAGCRGGRAARAAGRARLVRPARAGGAGAAVLVVGGAVRGGARLGRCVLVLLQSGPLSSFPLLPVLRYEAWCMRSACTMCTPWPAAQVSHHMRGKVTHPDSFTQEGEETPGRWCHPRQVVHRARSEAC